MIVKSLKVRNLLTASVFLFGLSAVAHADNWTSVATGLCLDSNFNGDVYALACNGTLYQDWYRSEARLVNLQTGLCLDSDLNGKAYTLPCNGGNFQNWYRSGERWVNYRTGRCLDGNNSGQVYTHECNGGNFQNWY